MWPKESSIGILLKCFEFDEVVSWFEHPLNLHPDLLDMIFDWMVGHVGAVVEMLHVISYQVSLSSKNCIGVSYSCLLTLSVPQRVSDIQHGVQFTVEAFHAENPTHNLVQAAELLNMAFTHGGIV